jgi:glycosyltransferase involved in cell wall biosynthesis
MPPKVSILVPVYNCESYVAESIQSILNQSFENFELIVIDGGSTDGTLRIVKEFRDRRIRLVDHKERFGLVESRNEGLSLAKGNIIAFQDADDISQRLRIAKQYSEFLVHDDLEVLGTSYTRIDHRRKALQRIQLAERISFKDLLGGMQLCNGSVMLRKNTILGEGMFDPFFRQCEDYELYCRLAQKGCKIMNLQESLYFLRDHPNRLSVSRWKEQALYLQLVRDMYSGFLDKRKIGVSLQSDPERLYSLLSHEKKRDYHLYLARKYIDNAECLLGLREFIRFAKLDPKEFALAMGKKFSL